MLFVVMFTHTTPAPSVKPKLSVVECEQSNNESSVSSHPTEGNHQEQFQNVIAL